MMRKLIGLIVLIAIVAGALLWRDNQQMGTAMAENEGAAIVEIVVPELSHNAKLGEAAFTEHCVTCHGQNAVGQQGVAPPLVHKIYEPGHHGDPSFVLAAKRGVRAHHWPFGDMPPVPDISDQEISNVITFIRELQRANGIN